MKSVDVPTARPEPPPTDEEIARRVLAGETALFELLMRRHNQLVYRAVRPLLRDESEVEDVMQQAYVQAYVALGQFAGRAQFRTWLVRIAVHEAMRRVHRARRHPQLGEDEDPADPAPVTPPDRAANRELQTLLEGAIDALPPIYRQVFVLREVEGLDTRDTAIALEVTEDVVKTRLRRAKMHLHRRLAAVAAAELGRAFAFEAPRCDRVVHGVLALLRAPNS
jgi:RNA polymerase sigma-70 factor (ECF subfamily)